MTLAQIRTLLSGKLTTVRGMPCLKGKENTVLALLEAVRTGGVQVIDLTYPVDEHSPYWPAGRDRSPFTARVATKFDLRACFERDLMLPELFGTHMVAPPHALPGRSTVDQVRVATLLNATCVVDIREGVQAIADYPVSVADLDQPVESRGAMPAGCFVFFFTRSLTA